MIGMMIPLCSKSHYAWMLSDSVTAAHELRGKHRDGRGLIAGGELDGLEIAEMGVRMAVGAGC
jgi:hypothetical protein